MEYKKLNIDIVKVWRIHRIINLVIMGVILLFLIVINLDFSFLNHTVFGIEIINFIRGTLVALLTYKVLGFFIFPKIEYRQWKYLIDNEKILIEHGIFWIKTIVIPISRIQHVTLKKGLIMARYNLQTIDISLASGSFEIPGIKSEDAEPLIELISTLVNIKTSNEIEITEV
ncbi:MAG: PH domain-containing protein [Bacilli bacterium]